MSEAPRITAEADIGPRDESVILDNFRLEANNVFPGSIRGTDVIHRRLTLSMTRPATMLCDGERDRCHDQIRDVFARVGLTGVVIDEREAEAVTLPSMGAPDGSTVPASV